MGLHELMDKVTDLEMHLRMSRACSSELREENTELRKLVIHCWVHSNYARNGYRQMTSEQKALYDEIINSADDV